MTNDNTEKDVASTMKAKDNKEIKTGWRNAPSLSDLKQDLQDAKPAKDEHVANVDRWLDILNVTGASKPPKNPKRSSIQPKVVKKNNEWRYPALSEPFLNTNDIFNVSPVTYEDKEAARQNALVLNYQFNNLLNKVPFIDSYVRTVTDEGTVFVRVGWERIEREEKVVKAQYSIEPTDGEEDIAILQTTMEAYQNGVDVGEEWIEAITATEQTQIPHVPVPMEDEIVKENVVVKNQPTIEVVNYNNLIIDPSCDGVLEDAKFVIHTFETNKADLEATGLYKNLDKATITATDILAASDDEFDSNDKSSFNFKDEPRKLFIAHEYWGYWDIEGDGVLKPIVVTWVGDTIIRMEENPYPDKAIPFVSAQYIPVQKSLYGEPDAELLEDNQKVIGATMRGMIDIMARSANGQTGFASNMLDAANRRKFENGQDYEFNPNIHPANGVYQHKFPEIPNSVLVMLQQQQFEVETMTGVRPFGATASDTAETATQARGLLDAASKKEIAILRRLAEGIKKIGHKIIAMNQEFLDDEEIIRVTNEDFVAIKREDLAGRFDLALDISSAEEDNAKAKELAFLLQTLGPNSDPKMVFNIMADIAELRKMPTQAKAYRDWQPPEPSPEQQMQQQIELQKLQLETAKMQLEMKKIESEIMLNQQRVGVEGARQSNIQSDTDLKNLEYVEEELGVNHERSMQLQAAQAKSNLERDLVNYEMKAQEKIREAKQKSSNSLSSTLDNAVPNTAQEQTSTEEQDLTGE